MSSRMLPMVIRRSMALSTANFAAVPWGRTLHRFMIPLYSPILDADLRKSTKPLPLYCPDTVYTHQQFWPKCHEHYWGFVPSPRSIETKIYRCWQ